MSKENEVGVKGFNDSYPINVTYYDIEGELKHLAGKMLTFVDMAILDKQSNKAWKDTIKQEFWKSIGRITTDMFDNLMEEHKKEEQDLLLQLEEYSNGNREFYITAVKLIDVASRAYSLLESSEPEEKTQLINFVLQNLRLKGRNLLFELKTPFNGILDYAKSGNLYPLTDIFRTLNSVKIIQELELLDNYSGKLCLVSEGK